MGDHRGARQALQYTSRPISVVESFDDDVDKRVVFPVFDEYGVVGLYRERFFGVF